MARQLRAWTGLPEVMALIPSAPKELLLWVSVVTASTCSSCPWGTGKWLRDLTWSSSPVIPLLKTNVPPGSQRAKVPFTNFMKAHGTSFLCRHKLPHLSSIT